MKTIPKIPLFLLLGAIATRPALAKDSGIPGPNSFVRILHAVASGPKVDVYIDGEKKLNDVEFSGLTKYLRVSSGTHYFKVVTNNPSRTIIDTSKTLRNGDFYTLGAYGTLARPRLFAYDDSASTVPYDRARVTFFNLSPNAAPFDVRATLKQNGDMIRIARGVRFGRPYAAVTPALPQSMRIYARGTTYKTITKAEPRAGRKYAAYAIGRVGRNFRVMLVNSGSQ